MSRIEESIEVDVPVQVAYNQWTQFETFPQFMEGVESVTQLDDRSLRWVADVSGRKREWIAEITEQLPDQRIAWRSITPDVSQEGVVDFHRIADGKSQLMVQMQFEPVGVAERAGDMLGMVNRQVKGDLERFKKFIEARGHETGGWRGKIEQPDVRS